MFWTAVILDVFALGVAWSAWKALDTTPRSLVIALPATLACVAATLVAGRILFVISRTGPRHTPARRSP